MESKESRSGSYAWKSNLQVRDVIKRGAKWRIVNGASTKIWSDNWLPSITSPRIQSPMVVELEEATVSYLIDSSSRHWNRDILPTILNLEEVEIVRKIPLSQVDAEDSLFWPYVQSGVYLVRSGYFFLKNDSQNLSPNSPAQVTQSSSFWKKIWSIFAPNKVRNFLWSACRNAIPTKANLAHRTVIDSAICDHCNHESEDVFALAMVLFTSYFGLG